MANFITRVELHGAIERDYIALHEAMGREGFSRTITSGLGVASYLPTAEYHFSGYASQNDVLQRAKRAAQSTNHAASIIVVEYTGCSWDGLTPVR